MSELEEGIGKMEQTSPSDPRLTSAREQLESVLTRKTDLLRRISTTEAEIVKVEKTLKTKKRWSTVKTWLLKINNDPQWRLTIENKYIQMEVDQCSDDMMIWFDMEHNKFFFSNLSIILWIPCDVCLASCFDLWYFICFLCNVFFYNDFIPLLKSFCFWNTCTCVIWFPRHSVQSSLYCDFLTRKKIFNRPN